MQSMSRIHDYHAYSSISEYLEALSEVGLHLSVIACWVIQSAMRKHGCSFPEAMDLLTASETVILLPRGEGRGELAQTPLPPINERLKDLDE